MKKIGTHMKKKQRMYNNYKKIIMLCLAGILLAGCSQKAAEDDSIEEVQAEIETVSEEVSESTEIENVTGEIEPLETIVLDESTIEQENAFQFSQERGEAVECVLGKEDYDRETAMVYRIDMDLDGVNEIFVFVPLYENMSGNNGKEGYVACDLWLVSKNGYVEKICEDTDIALTGYFYKATDRRFVILNSATALVNEQSMVVEYFDGKTKIRKDFPGSVVVNEEEEMVVWAEDYLGSSDVTDVSTPREGLWSGHTWIPYYLHYDTKVEDLVVYDTTIVSKDTVEDMAELDASYFENADAVQFIYVERGWGYLEVNTAVKDFSSDMYQDIAFTNYEFCLDGYNGKWEFVQERSGIYKLDYCEDVEWAFLDTGINEECIDPYTLLGTAPSKEIIDQYGYEDGHSVLGFDIVPQTVQEYEEYYVVDAVYAKAIEAPGDLAIGERVTLVFNELTGDKRILERREDGLHQPEDAENEPYYPTYFNYWVREDGSPVVLYDENSDRVDKPVYEGKLYIRKDATIEYIICYDIDMTTKDELNRENYFNGVCFDENGYVTRLVSYGD